MWISTRAQYGMRALVEIGLTGDSPVSLKTISERHKISQNYLEQIVAVLRKAGIVESLRGAYGGYRLARAPHDVSALEVVELMEGSLAPVACLDEAQGCEHEGNCSTEGLWTQVDTAVRNVLQATNLADLIAERKLISLEALPAEFSN